MVTIVGAANRRLERLLESDRAQGGDARERCRGAASWRWTICSARSISWRAPPIRAEAAAVRERIVALLDRCERELSVLLDATAQPRAPAGRRGTVAPPSRRRRRRKRICASGPGALAPALGISSGRNGAAVRAAEPPLRRGQRTAPARGDRPYHLHLLAADPVDLVHHVADHAAMVGDDVDHVADARPLTAARQIDDRVLFRQARITASGYSTMRPWFWT